MLCSYCFYLLLFPFPVTHLLANSHCSVSLFIWLVFSSGSFNFQLFSSVMLLLLTLFCLCQRKEAFTLETRKNHLMRKAGFHQSFGVKTLVKIMKISALTTAMKKHLALLFLVPKMCLLFQMTPKEAHPLRVNLITNPVKQSNHWLILQWDLNELNLYENARVAHNCKTKLIARLHLLSAL